MKKKQVKSNSPTVQKQSKQVETPRFKEKATQISQPPQSPKLEIDSNYFSFGGMDKQLKKQSKSVYQEPKKLNNSFEKKVVVQKPQKVQIFNNNYQIININQIEKKDSIRSLQRQFQQILDNQPKQSPNKRSTSPVTTKVYPSANNYFQRMKKTGQSTLLRKKF